MSQSPVDSQSAATTGAVLGKFVKVQVPGTRKYGQYRGEGNLQVNATGLVITGSHVYPLGLRWLVGIAVAIAVYLLTLGTLMPGILLMYPLVEYLWLKKGNQTIPFHRIEAFKSVAKKELIAIQFKGARWETPVVLKSEQWRVVYDALLSRIPRASK
jgi:hypothetical protein